MPQDTEKQQTKTRAQVGLLLGRDSPLTAEQKETLRREIREGKVKVTDG